MMTARIPGFQFYTLLGVLIFLIPAEFLYSQIPNFHIGTKWIYETEEGPLPVKTSFEVFQITDTIQLHGKSVFVIENGFGQEVEYMHVENSMVYFWDNGTEEFQLTYDFGSDSLYTSRWHACSGTEGEALVRIDSVTSFFQQGDVLEIQHIRIENNGSTEDDIIADAYKNIGLNEFGLRLPLGHDVCDFNKHFTKLRCFESDSVSYHFVDYPCDSTWFSILTSDVLDDFVSPEKTWTEGYYNSDWWSFKYKFGTIPFVFEGKTYYQLLRAYSEFSKVWESEGSLIRYENGRVFLHGNVNEQIMYNFNLMEGDTFHMGDLSYPQDLLVTHVDYISLLNGDLKKRLILAPINPPEDTSAIVWIEGIGNLQGLFKNYLPWSADADYSKILCVRWNENIMYDNPDIDSCWMMTTSINNPEDSYQPLYPNPTSGIIHISDLEAEVLYEIYDLQGKKIQSGVSNNGEISIDQQGMFILRIYLNNNWVTKRVVVIT